VSDEPGGLSFDQFSEAMRQVEEHCGHCERPLIGAARGWAADSTLLCHTGTVPPDDDPPDCFRLVTVYQHVADGSCCRSDWYPDAEEAHRLGCMPDVRVDVYTNGTDPPAARAIHTATGTIAVAVGAVADLRARALLARKLTEADDA